MNISDLFLAAARQKFRFESSKGQLTVEDLWDLPLTSQTGKVCLDEVARNLYQKMNEAKNISFVTPKVEDETVQQKFDIVKYVIEVRIAERDEAAKAKQRAERRQNLMDLIAQKETNALAELSVDDLKKMLAEV